MFDSATVVSVVNLVKPASRTAGPTLIGIDGLTAAGKSTLARQIAQDCQDAPIIHLDDFYREFSTEAMASFSAREGYHRYFDWERLLHHVLDKLRRGETASYDRFDWSHGSPAARTMVEPHGVILVEGVYAVRPELQHAFDATVFVGTPRSVRTSRIEGRKNEDTVWVSQWRAAEEWYVRYFSPKKRCDLVIAGG